MLKEICFNPYYIIIFHSKPNFSVKNYLGHN